MFKKLVSMNVICWCSNSWFIDFKFLGDRTIGVLTKIDLMDKGTDAVDVSQT